MKRIIFYFYLYAAIICKVFSEYLYMKFIIKAYKFVGVRFLGIPEYIDYHSHLDPSGGLELGKGTVISTNVIILTHDWSFLKKMKVRGEDCSQELSVKALKSVSIGDETFIGAGSIILPGSRIGKFCIIGAGAVVKGEFEDYSVIIGSPARRIKDIRD
jgi:acetyltransferase-like isoleucine patch superfamily enzyme